MNTNVMDMNMEILWFLLIMVIQAEVIDSGFINQGKNYKTPGISMLSHAIMQCTWHSQVPLNTCVSGIIWSSMVTQLENIDSGSITLMVKRQKITLSGTLLMNIDLYARITNTMEIMNINAWVIQRVIHWFQPIMEILPEGTNSGYILWAKR